MASLQQAGTVGAGAAVPLVSRNVLDNPGGSLTRPSVLAGVAGTALGFGLSMAVDNGMVGPLFGSRRMFSEMAMMFGTGSLAGTLYTVFTPSNGGDFALPSL